MPILLTQTVPPTVEPVSVADLKMHLRVDNNDENDYLTALSAAARQYVETFTGRQMVNATWVYKLAGFPSERQIVLPRVPLSSVSTVTYYDETDTLQTLAATEYVARTEAEPGYLELDYGTTWPSTYSRSDAVAITFIAGYGATAASVPAALRHLVKLLAGHWFEQREPVITGTITAQIPMALESLLWQWRAVVL